MFSWPPLQNFPRWGMAAFWLYLLTLVVLFGTTTNDADADLWHRFALFDFLTRTGHFPQGDTFSYLGDPARVADHEWGSAFIFYPIYHWAEGTGLVVLKLLTLAGTLILSVRAGLGTRRPSMLETFFYVLVLLALLSSFLSTLRCGAFSHLIFALWVFWFQQERRGIAVPVLFYALSMTIWANLHGGFVLGFVWLGIIGAWEFFTGGNWRRRALILGLCLVGTLINPFGYQLWEGLIRALFVSRAAFPEWSPVSWIHDYKAFSGYKLLVLWMIAVVFGHVWRNGWKKCDQMAILLLGVMLMLSWLQVRQTSIFAVAVGGLLPPLFPPEKSLHEISAWKPWLHRFVVRAILLILPFVMAFRFLPTNQGFQLHFSPENCPVGAVNYLKDQGVTGNLLVDFNSGSYALWELRGKMRVSMDTRYEVAYSPAAFERVQRFYLAEDGWRDVLMNPIPDAILVDLPAAVYPKLLEEPGWTQVYHDETQAVFMRRASGL